MYTDISADFWVGLVYSFAKQFTLENVNEQQQAGVELCEVSIDLKLARLFKRLDLDQRDLCKTPTQNEAH